MEPIELYRDYPIILLRINNPSSLARLRNELSKFLKDHDLKITTITNSSNKEIFNEANIKSLKSLEET